MISADVGVATPLELTLYDGATNQGARARIRTISGTLVTTVNLTHIGDGVYTSTWTPVSAGYYIAEFTVYTDGTYTTENLFYTNVSEVYKVSAAAALFPDAATIAGTVWDTARSGHTSSGSFGEAAATTLQQVGTTDTKVTSIKSTVESATYGLAAIKTAVDSGVTTSAQIKLKTDNLPADPAREATVNLRPTNPLLTTDTRLNRLDANISSRSTLTTSDLAALARTTDLTGLAHSSELTSLAAKTDLTPLAHITDLAALAHTTDLIPLARTTDLTPLAHTSDLTGLARTTDLIPLATEADILSSQSVVVGKIETNRDLIVALGQLALLIKAKTDLITNDPSTMTALIAAQNSILDAIAAIPSDNTGMSVEQIWSYFNRTLTTDFSNLAEKVDLVPLAHTSDLSTLASKTDLAAIEAMFAPLASKTDLAPLATKADVTEIEGMFAPIATKDDLANLATKDDISGIATHQYTNRMTTTFRPDTDQQEILVWSEKDGEVVPSPSDCVMSVKSSTGTLIWSQGASTPGPDGIFRFINPIVVSADSNYYVSMSVKVDGIARISQQAFITIG